MEMFSGVPGWERSWPWLLTALAGGYALGSAPWGLIVARMFGLGDVRRIGSGNIGATNVLRTGNRTAAAVTLLLDAAKGAGAVLIFAHWGPLAAQLAGLTAFLGHLFPVWLRFRGGKGVATFLGLTLALSFPAGLLCCAAWLAAALAFRISSLSALIAAASAPLWMALLGVWSAIWLAALLAALVWVRHHANIRRLLRGEEPKIDLGGKP